ncbi:ATP-binding cassette domain-containing protein [Streptomyces sp. NPDC001118]
MSVRYDGAPSDALREASARIPAGARVAVVGESGAGKSTLMKALVRFLEPSAGRLLVDGVDVRGYDAGAYRRRVATVPQDVFLFRGTVRDAIAYGVPGASPAEVEAAARAVGAHPVLAGLPDGYDHAVGVRGGNLSAGQRQLAVAYEDVDFFRRVRQAGANLAYEPAASVGHDHRETLATLPAKVWSYGVHSRAVGRVSGPWSALRGFVRMHSRPNDQLRGALKDDIVRRRPVFALLDCYLLACSLWQFLPHLLHDQGFEWTVPADGFGVQGAVLTLAEDGLRYAWVCVAGAVPSMDCAFAVAMDGLVPVPDERYLSMTAALLADARPG